MDLSKVCNIGIMVYIDVGKIMMIECILFYMGVNYKFGEMYDGVLIIDWMEQEKECGIMIMFVVVICFWNKNQINIIDIFGYVDFMVEVECLFCVFDGVVVVFDGKEGVEFQFEIVWCQVDKYNVFCICFVNKMDKFGVDFYFMVDMIVSCFGVKLFVIQLFIGVENDFIGVVDFIEMCVLVWFGDVKGDVIMGVKYEVQEILVDLKDKVEEYCQQFFEIVVEIDDVLFEKFFGGEEFLVVEIKGVICKLIIVLEIYLVFCGFVFKNCGVQLMFDVVVDFLLNFFDVGVIEVYDLKDYDMIIECYFDVNDLFLVFVFKVVVYLFFGCLIYVCVYLGYFDFGFVVINLIKGKKECIGKIFQMYVNKENLVDLLIVGNIYVVIGLKDIIIGDILFDIVNLVVFELMMFLELVIEVVIELKIKVDQEKLGFVIQKFVEEDLIFCMEFNFEIGQMIIKGMGELYFDIFVDCMKCEFCVEVNVGKFQVVYCEMICKVVEKYDYMYKKQIGGLGQFVKIQFMIEFFDLDVEKIYEFVNVVIGGCIFCEYIGLIDVGFQDVMNVGVFVGYLMVGVKVIIVDGVVYDVDFLEMVFKIVGFMGFKEVVCCVNFVLFELLMVVEVCIFEEYMGDVIGDLNLCCGQIQLMEDVVGVKVVCVQVLLFEMFGYIGDLCLKILGCVVYLMEFYSYVEVFCVVVDEIVQKIKGE